jgi:plastocyanin
LRLALGLAVVLAATGVHAEERSHTVRIEAMKFVPARLEAAMGDTVTWVSLDFVPHDVTALDKAVTSGEISSGGRWTLKLGEAGRAGVLLQLASGHAGRGRCQVIQMDP